MRAPAKRRSRITRPFLCARVSPHVRLETDGTGQVAASFNGYSVSLGAFSSGLVGRLHDLRAGVPLALFAAARRKLDRELNLFIRRLAQRGLLEYCLRRSQNGEDLIVIEPQTADYWPGTAPLHSADVLVLSRFAYMRRRGNEMVLESPRAAALFKICNPAIAGVIAALSAPQTVKSLARQRDFPGNELFALMVDCEVLFKVDASKHSGFRQSEGDHNLVFWDFHDLLFHARSTEGRQNNPLGGTYPHIGVAPPLPAVRPPWTGKKIDLHNVPADGEVPFARLLHERHSTREFDSQRPITIAELSRFLENTARVRSTSVADTDGPPVTYTVRPYPSAGASYELELYLAVNQCGGLDRGLYHYDAGGHSLVSIGVRPAEFEALLSGARFAMDAPRSPQILIVITARFGRMSWKYSALAYALILKDVGVLTQTFYLMATDMGLGGCAIGIVNIDLFAKMTGIGFHIEGPVGQFALGRGSASSVSD